MPVQYFATTVTLPVMLWSMIAYLSQQKLVQGFPLTVTDWIGRAFGCRNRNTRLFGGARDGMSTVALIWLRSTSETIS